MSKSSRSSRSSRSSQAGKRLVRRPSFILIDENEEEDISCFTILGNTGIPALYILAIVSLLIGTICMGVITSYWSGMEPPQCFLYSETASSTLFYKFGSSLSKCYFVAYGGIPAIIISIICGIIYLAHVKDDKTVDFISCLCIGGVFVSTVLMLTVVCTLSQGMRITCAAISLNPMNNKGYSCDDKINNRVVQYNVPVKTSAMIDAATVTLWIGTTCLMVITAFHIAMVVRRRTSRSVYYD